MRASDRDKSIAPKQSGFAQNISTTVGIVY